MFRLGSWATVLMGLVACVTACTPGKVPNGTRISSVLCLAFSADGKMLASGEHMAGMPDFNCIRIYDVAIPREIKKLPGRASSVVFSRKGDVLASTGSGPAYHLWEVESGKEITKKEQFAPLQGGATCVVYSADESTLVTADCSKTITFWSLPDGKPTGSFVAYAGDSTGERLLVISRDGNYLAYAANDPSLAITIWDFKTHKLLRTLKGHRRQVTSLAFSPDGKRLVSCSRDTTVRIWDVEGERQVHSLRGVGYLRPAVAWSCDGEVVASGGEYGVRVWNAASGREEVFLDKKEKGCNALAFSPDNTTLALSLPLKLLFWDYHAHKEIKSVDRPIPPQSYPYTLPPP